MFILYRRYTTPSGVYNILFYTTTINYGHCTADVTLTYWLLLYLPVIIGTNHKVFRYVRIFLMVLYIREFIVLRGLRFTVRWNSWMVMRIRLVRNLWPKIGKELFTNDDLESVYRAGGRWNYTIPKTPVEVNEEICVQFVWIRVCSHHSSGHRENFRRTYFARLTPNRGRGHKNQ